MMNILKCCVRLVWILVTNIYVVPSYFIWLLLFRPVLWFNPRIFWQIEEVFFGWLLTMVACWNYTAGYDVMESGDLLEDVANERFLFMPNHQSTADVPFCMTLFSARPHFADHVMWVMDRLFKFSNFGVVSWMHDDFFILAGKKNRQKSLVQLMQHLQTVFVQKSRKYLVLFPEGGFLRKRKEVSRRYALKMNFPHLEYVTLPRTGALEAILNILGPQAGSIDLSLVEDFAENQENAEKILRNHSFFVNYLGKLVDVTIAYPGGKPLDLWSIFSGNRGPCVTHIHYRIFDLSELPSTSAGIKVWMYNLYFEKEKMLEEYHKTGIFPFAKYTRDGEQPLPLRPLVHNPYKFVFLHAFFAISAFIFFKWFRAVW